MTAQAPATLRPGSRRRSTLAAVRAAIVDLTAIALALLVAVTAAVDSDRTGRVTGDAAAWSLALAGIGCAALWWRRRHPVAVALLLAPVAAATEFVGGAVLVAVYTVAVRRRPPTALAMIALHVAAYLPYSILRPSRDTSIFVDNLVGAVLLLAAWGVGSAVRARRQSRRARVELVASLRERAAQAEAEAELRAERHRAAEREHIAREMHDTLAHRISQVSLLAGALETRRDLSGEEVARAAASIRAGAHQALEELREILGVLRPGADGAALRPPPGLAGLDDLIAQFRAAGIGDQAIAVDADISLPDGGEPPPAVSRTAYRVVQEGLTNAAKHAPGARVHLRVRRTPGGELHVWLRNALVDAPAPAVPGTRCGLVGLAERVQLAGGRIDHGVRRGAGGDVAFHLEAWMPWPM